MRRKIMATFDKKYRRQIELDALSRKRISEMQLDNYSEPVSAKIERIKDVTSTFYVKIGKYNHG